MVEARACKYFLEGRCKQGDSCRYVHEGYSPSSNATAIGSAGGKHHRERRVKRERCKLVGMPVGQVEVAVSREHCEALCAKLSAGLQKMRAGGESRSVLFIDLHKTFSLIIAYAREGPAQCQQMREMLSGLAVVIVTFVGWDNDNTRAAIADIEWAVQHLAVVCGVCVSERNRTGVTDAEQTFVGGKGWLIGYIVRADGWAQHVQHAAAFADDSEDHLQSVRVMAGIDKLHKAKSLDGLAAFIKSL